MFIIAWGACTAANFRLLRSSIAQSVICCADPAGTNSKWCMLEE